MAATVGWVTGTWWDEIGPNTTSGFWHWSHTPKDWVVTVCAVPDGGDNPPNQWYGLEITDVGYYAIDGFVNDRRFRFRIKNPNPFKVTYETKYSFVSP